MNALQLSQGHVYHSRREGAKTAFRYPTFFTFFNCDNEEGFLKTLRQNFFGLLSFQGKDYLQQTPAPVSSTVKNFLKEQCGYQPDQVWLYSMPRMFGYAFNPVSFWCCYKKSQLDAILVEVHNTFGERHFYWIQPENGIKASEWYKAEKHFHVSPFFPVDGFYKFRFDFLSQSIKIYINYYNPDGSIRLVTWVDGELTPLENHSFLALFFKYGWITPLVVLRIHYQAFKLWLRKSHFYSKPLPPQKEITK